jgi:hypothetical protein
MDSNNQEAFLNELGDDVPTNHRKARFWQGCDDPVIDIEKRKETRIDKKLVASKTKPRVFTEDEKLEELYKMNSLMYFF